MWIMNQHRVTWMQVHKAHQVLISFAQEFKIIYCQHLVSHINFVQPCVHSLVHLPCEAIRLGPPICSSQWTLERTIGNLGKEIKQHSNPFANLSQRGIQCARTNTLQAMIPVLLLDVPWPRAARAALQRPHPLCSVLWACIVSEQRSRAYFHCSVFCGSRIVSGPPF